MALPLPNIQDILWKVSKYPYRSLIDGKEAYEQIGVGPEDVPKTLFTTPSGTMTSEVMQIGDFTSRGIQMDPHKVDTVVNWKVPNTKEQLMSFIGAVGYLALDCDGIRIPMGILTSRASLHKNWNWDGTAQRAFEETKEIVNKWRDHHRIAIDYSENALPINLVTDASLTGASGVLSQGENIETAKIAMFWSGKFTPTQQNYPVHTLELYAIKELLAKFQYQLYGTKFRIHTDNKSLINILTQKNLSGRQARWLEAMNQFNFTIIHIPGEENKVADALLRIYADEPEGSMPALSKYVPDDNDSED
ncbi:hypothetical protein FRC09_002672 [Ceratobasidium sp. 395]|nr:hypothetical protein FRC09_002672 [Ceratobasidium sp. 395]